METNRDKEINRILHEMMGLCWCDKLTELKREPHESFTKYVCSECNRRLRVRWSKVATSSDEELVVADNPTYLEHGKHWGNLLNWSGNQSWYEDFRIKLWQKHFRTNKLIHTETGIPFWPINNPRSLAESLVEYREGLKDG